MGLVTPNGVGTEASWESLLNGQSGVGPITSFESEAYPCRIAAEVKGFDPAQFIAKRKLKEMCRFTQFALSATKMAVESSGLVLSDEEKLRTGCFIGVGLGGLENLERVTLLLHEKGPGKVSPYFIPSIIGNLAA
ncbi:MAG: beta-ketoacyl synthase N-terminal-like domain-containing protein, partial [Polyangiaceae bacterium]